MNICLFKKYNHNILMAIWIEKYRPSDFDNIIGQDKNINIIDMMISKGSLPHMLFHGPSGVGKTSTIMSIANKLYGKNKTFMMMKLDASDDRGISTVREEIKGFAEKITPFNIGIKLIILDEADSMTYDAQFALRRIIEKYSDTTRFCLICNYENKIIPPIKARCVNFRFYPINNKIISSRLKYIAKKESLKCTPDSIKSIASISNGDLRKAINILQSVSMMNKPISEKLCYDVCGIIEPLIIKTIYDKLVDKESTFDNTYEYLRKHILETGISLNFILHQLTRHMIDEIDNINFTNIISEMSKLESYISISTFNDIYVVGLVAIFKKYYSP